MSEIKNNSSVAGLNLNNTPLQVKEGETTYALNAVVQGFDGNSITYQNEQGNELCCKVKSGYTVIGKKSLPDRDILVLFLVDTVHGHSEIATVKDCVYTTFINAKCLNFSIDHPIKKSVPRGGQIYFTDNFNPRRYIDLDNPPFLEVYNDINCENFITAEVDCNKLKVQPSFAIPQIKAVAIEGDAELRAGTYQFAVQYSDSNSNPYTQYFSKTNPIPIHDPLKTTQDFDYPVSKSISLEVTNLDKSGIYDFVNVCVIKTINNISSFQLVGTYDIRNQINLVYTGQSLLDLSADDLFEIFPIYDTAKDVFAVQEILGWADLKEKDRISYQKIFNQLELQWETHREFGDGYKNPLVAANKRGYMRDEIYPIEGVLMFDDGAESDRHHIPGRQSYGSDMIVIDNQDSVTGEGPCSTPTQGKPKWQTYNTGEKLGSYIPTCEEIQWSGGTADSTNTVNATIFITCDDDNCTQQGKPNITINIEQPVSTPIYLEIGMIQKYTQIGNIRRGMGFELHELPPGVEINNYYSIPSSPFVIEIPANTATITIPHTQDIKQKAWTNPAANTWICHGCFIPIDTLFIKANNAANKNIVFTTNQPIYMYNIPTGAPSVIKGEPPVAQVVQYPCMDDCYTGPYEYGSMAYWESIDTYDCDESIWGELAGKPIRHHKFPDNLITHHHDKEGYIYPIGIKFNVQQLIDAINASDLTEAQKKRIVGIKLLRGNRVNNKSVVAKGLINNVLKYTSNNRLIDTKITIGRNDDIVTTSIEQAQALLKRAGPGVASGNQPAYDHAKPQLDIIKDNKDKIGTDEFNGMVQTGIDAFQAYYEELSTNDKKSYVESIVQVLQSLLDVSLSMQEAAADLAASIAENQDAGSLLDITTDGESYFPNYLFNDVRVRDPFILLKNEQGAGLIYDESNKFRYTMHSPDTSFYQPTLGNILKIESVEKGRSTSHISEVKRHAKYQMINANTFLTALISGVIVGFASGMYGVADQPFDGGAAFTTYRTLLDIIFKLTPRRNFAHQINAVGDYYDFSPVGNSGNKIRNLDIATYLAPGKFNVGDDKPINNFQRESSVYLRTQVGLPYTHEQTTAPQDRSKTIFADMDDHESTVASYYASIKKNIPNQWGQIYSYEPIDTGYAKLFNLEDEETPTETVFGGDVFINRFAYKSKFPFFTDNRVNPDGTDIFPDESDIFYNELSNVGRVKYWFSTDATKGTSVLKSIFGIRPKHFFWPRNRFFNDFGFIFLFAYGIPYFFVESEVNIDLRQAYNSKEGDFYPHVGSTIPDEWLQEYLVSIQHDNSYNYNKSYSKQNKEHFYSKIPLDFTNLQKNDLNQRNRFKIIYSDQEDTQPRNNWLIYRPASSFDLPKTFGPLTSIEALEDRAILVRFADRSMIYNALVTIDTSTPKAAYIGNEKLFKGAPPLDFAETEIGYNGSQHVFFLKTEFGHISVDAKRGRVFLLSGNKAKDITDEQSGVSSFFRQHLPFEISKKFPTFDIDNNYKNVGLHGVFNGRRFILTKLDYKPTNDDIKYVNGEFYLGTKKISLFDPTYFCPNSFSISFNFDTGRWVSFHSYLPNYYIDGVKNFYSGNKDLWIHENNVSLYNNYYGIISPYILETPLVYQAQDMILQDVRSYTKVYKQLSETSAISIDDIFFNKSIIYNDEHCSGLRHLYPKPIKNLQLLRQYPKAVEDGINIYFTKSDNLYSYNMIWDVVKDKSLPIFTENCSVLDKDLNEENMNYTLQGRKTPIRGKDVKIRHILDNTSDYKLISQFVLSENQTSFK